LYLGGFNGTLKKMLDIVSSHKMSTADELTEVVLIQVSGLISGIVVYYCVRFCYCYIKLKYGEETNQVSVSESTSEVQGSDSKTNHHEEKA